MQTLKFEINPSMDVYGAENYITIVDSPGVDSKNDSQSDFSRLLTNSLNETVNWMIQKLIIVREDNDARREKLKVFYPQVFFN